jgi:hypothetical protein
MINAWQVFDGKDLPDDKCSDERGTPQAIAPRTEGQLDASGAFGVFVVFGASFVKNALSAGATCQDKGTLRVHRANGGALRRSEARRV